MFHAKPAEVYWRNDIESPSRRQRHSAHARYQGGESRFETPRRRLAVWERALAKPDSPASIPSAATRIPCAFACSRGTGRPPFWWLDSVGGGVACRCGRVLTRAWAGLGAKGPGRGMVTGVVLLSQMSKVGVCGPLGNMARRMAMTMAAMPSIRSVDLILCRLQIAGCRQDRGATAPGAIQRVRQ
jgi:hypothetical protein